MFSKLHAVAVIAVVCYAGSARANELEAIHHHYLLGHWSCIGHVHTPDGDRVNTVGSWKIKKAFHGHVYDKFENYTGKGFKYVAKGLTSYDKLAGVLNRHVVSSMNTWTRYVSKGWGDDDTLTWDGESHAFGHPPIGISQVITKKDDNTFELRINVQQPRHHGKDDGSDGFKTMYKGTCSRDSGQGGSKDDGKAGDADKQNDGDAIDQDDDDARDAEAALFANW